MLTAAAIFAAGASPSLLTLVLALLVAGGSDAVIDIAQNAHRLRVQRRYGRSIINSFHALWSAGVVLGGGMAAAAIALDVPRALHLGLSGLVFVVVALVAHHFCLPGLDDRIADPVRATASVVENSRLRTALIFCGLVVIGIVACLVEDAGNSWATLYLAESRGAPAAIAATGYIALAAAQFSGRIVGDRFIYRFGQRTVVRPGGGLIVVGMGAAIAFPTIPGAIMGFAAAGLGVATLGPTAMNAADDLPGLKPGTGLTIASWLMRIGFLASPSLVGFIADASSLRIGLFVFPTAGIIVLLAAAAFRRGAVTVAKSGLWAYSRGVAIDEETADGRGVPAIRSRQSLAALVSAAAICSARCFE